MSKYIGKAFWNGHWHDPLGAEQWVLQSPIDRSHRASCRNVSSEQIDEAINSANASFPKWRDQSVSARIDVLNAIADALLDKKDHLAEIVSNEVGTPIKFCARLQVESAANVFRRTASLLKEVTWLDSIDDTQVHKVPIGVVACITPWNYPLFLSACKIAPALAAGCSVVLKPSEYSSFSMTALTDIISNSNLPDGVFSLLPGDGKNVGQYIVHSKGIHKVSFTGSVVTGAAIGADAGMHVKPVALELGGKSASVMLRGADLGSVVVGTVSKGFQNAGQTCAALTRLVVPQEHLAMTESLVLAEVKKIILGDPREHTTTMGPLVNTQQQKSVNKHIQDGISQGANLLCGGISVPDELNDGCYVTPTVFSNVTTSMSIAQEEIFGPVLCIQTYNEEHEATAIANSTPYALSGAVWAEDDATALKFAQNMHAGSISINGAPTHPDAPFGGFDHSGYGRERGRYAIESYLTTKTYNILRQD